MTRAIVHSIHSQVPETIAGLNRRFDMILSLDSHLDVSLGGDYGVYPSELRIFAQRTSVHSALRDISGGFPPLRPIVEQETSNRGRRGDPREDAGEARLRRRTGAPTVAEAWRPEESISSVVRLPHCDDGH